MRPQLMKLLEQADELGNGTIQFQGFLKMMRHLQNMWDEEKLQKENTVFAEVGLPRHEVEEFRNMYLAIDQETYLYLPFEAVCKMVKNICPLGNRNMAILQGIFDEYAAPPPGFSEDAEPMVDFPDFLRVMKKAAD